MSLKRSFYDWSKRLVEGIYFRVFGEEMTAGMRGFVKNLGITTLSFFIASLFFMIFQIVNGRLLGPEDYGKFTLLDSTAQYIYALMTLGLSTAAVYYLPNIKENKKRQDLIKTMLVFIVVSGVFWSILFSLFSNTISVSLGVSDSRWLILVCVYAFSFSLQYFIRSVLRGLEMMKAYAWLEIISAVLTLGFSLFMLFFIGDNSFFAPVVSRIFGYGILFVAGFLLLRLLKGNFSGKLLKKIMGYSLSIFIFWFLLIATNNLDKVMVSKILSNEDLGVYFAYILGSNAIIYQLVIVFIINFFPAISRSSQKQAIFKKINCFQKKAWPYLLAFGGLTTYLLLIFFGNDYKIDVFKILLLSVNTVFYSYFQILVWEINSLGSKYVKKSASILFLGVILQWLFFYILINSCGLNGAIVALLLTNLSFYIMFSFQLHKIMNIEGKNNEFA